MHQTPVVKPVKNFCFNALFFRVQNPENTAFGRQYPGDIFHNTGQYVPGIIVGMDFFADLCKQGEKLVEIGCHTPPPRPGGNLVN
jgi:hypothetical protein